MSLAKTLRRRLLHDRGSKPRLRAHDWFTLDTNSYRVFERREDRRFKGAWIAISGLEKRRRICVPLAGPSLADFKPRSSKKNSRPGLLVIVRDRVTLVVTKRVPMPALRATSFELGIDKGYTVLLTASRGDASTAKSYGKQSGELISRIAETDAARYKNRKRLGSLARSLRSTDRAKARRIRRRNLGRQKQQRISRRHNTHLRQQIGEAVNGLFSDHPRLSVLHVESLNFAGKPLSTMINRRLGRWLKGRLQSSLLRKAQLHGVRLNVVNAAFTSLTCPVCWFPSRTNRHGERFVCRSCGYSGSADAVAATNVLKRGRDRAITCFTRREQVRQILETRWRPALSGGAWDSSGVADGATSEPRITAQWQSTDDVACLAAPSHEEWDEPVFDAAEPIPN